MIHPIARSLGIHHISNRGRKMSEECFMCGKKTAEKYHQWWFYVASSPVCPKCWDKLASGRIKTGLNYGIKDGHYYFCDDCLLNPEYRASRNGEKP
jgi:hypothetical protein